MRSPPQDRRAERQARFEAVYAAYRTPVLGYALRRTLSPDDAADILAETFLVAWRKLDQVPAGPDARLWLFGVARNALANYYRGERRRSALAARLGTELAQSYLPPEYDGESAAIGLDRQLRRECLQLRELLGIEIELSCSPLSEPNQSGRDRPPPRRSLLSPQR